LPQPGSTEIVVGQSVAQRFQGVELGASLNFATRDWTIVGIFDAGKTGFSSEIWGDVDQLMQAFRRPVYSSILFRLRDPSRFPELKQRIETDPRLTLEAYLEPDYYRKQSEMMATFLRILGLSLTLIFSFGAVVGAMITMYAAVANRTTEIGTLRALGFQRSNILLAFLLESLFLGFLGGILGLLCASVLQVISVSTTNFQTFSELAFSFVLTPRIVMQALAFALIMGLLGGILPAIRAARMNLVEALREA
jgi:ABC-type lipoprotein release transport system permease subunit